MNREVDLTKQCYQIWQKFAKGAKKCYQNWQKVAKLAKKCQNGQKGFPWVSKGFQGVPRGSNYTVSHTAYTGSGATKVRAQRAQAGGA